ncbi:MAG: hypothetical protein NTY15_04355 [Planctomycetota bacterium]|nr:hypothetical protein [Planctomycetota bacterium]
MPFPSDIPTQKIIPNSTLTATGSLETGFDVVYTVPNSAKVVYHWERKTVTNGDQFVGDSTSYQMCIRYGFAWIGNKFVTKSIQGYTSKRETSYEYLPRTVNFAAAAGNFTSIAENDKVGSVATGFVLERNRDGVDEAVIKAHCTLAATIKTKKTLTERMKDIKSLVQMAPTHLVTTTPVVDERLSVTYNSVPGTTWNLVRGFKGNLKTDSGSYPRSDGTANQAGSLSFGAFAPDDSFYGHLIGAKVVNPPEASRNIYFYENFMSFIPWTVPPFLSW